MMLVTATDSASEFLMQRGRAGCKATLTQQLYLGDLFGYASV